MSDVPSAGWRAVAAWCHVPEPGKPHTSTSTKTVREQLRGVVRREDRGD